MMADVADGKNVVHTSMVQVKVLIGVLVLAIGLCGCANTDNGASGSTSQVAHKPHPIVPFNDAIDDASEQMFQSFKMDGDNGTAPLPFVIDPLIDGATGAQSKGTKYIQDKVLALAKTKYPRFQVQPFTPTALNSKPLVLIGTLNTINPAAQMKGKRTSWWLCVVLVDLKSGKVVAKGVALAQLGDVDITPLDYFKDSPAWTQDDATSTYVNNCQTTKVGDLIDPKYLSGLYASSAIAQAIEAYDNGKYRQALELYNRAASLPGGSQFRVYTGLYLTNQKLGNRAAESEAFRQLVDFGLAKKRLAVKFLFRPGTTQLVTDQKIGGPYDMWLHEIAQESVARDVCLDVTGHTTPTGPAPVNRALSLQRANFIKNQLDTIEPPLTQRTIAHGLGSRENLIGTGKDDYSDVLDRRVEFKVNQSACGAQGAEDGVEDEAQEVEKYNVY